MTAYDLYHDLTMQGFRLSVNGGNLELVPFSRLTADQCTQIRQYKADLMALAANDQEAQEEADWHEFLYGKSTEELLYNHLLTCPLCYVEAAQYCLYGVELGKQYDALLLKQEDAQAKRKALALQVDRACISGRSVLNRVTHASVLNRSKMRHNKDA